MIENENKELDNTVAPDEFSATTENSAVSAQPHDDKKHLGKPKNLGQRLITAAFIAVLYAGFILLTIYADSRWFYGLVLVLSLTSAYEFSKAIGLSYAKPISFFVYANILVGTLLFFLLSEYFEQRGGITAAFGTVVVMFIICLAYVMMNPKLNMNNALSTLFVMIYPETILTYLLALSYLGEFSPVAIIMAFGATTLTDTMAYFIGSIFRGPKLCPHISPNKTVSGCIGGLGGGLLAGIIIWVFAEFGIFNCEPIVYSGVANFFHFVMLGLITAVSCQIGDLISSYIKRQCNIKDFGNVLRGHGGFMDRIDGLIVSSVFIYAYFTVVRLVLGL